MRRRPRRYCAESLKRSASDVRLIPRAITDKLSLSRSG